MPAKIPDELLPAHFWSRVNKKADNECWEWTGATTSAGYGNLVYGGTSAQAHRVAYMLTRGGISIQTKFRTPGWAAKHKKFVLHECDNRLCCNPAHLHLGTLSRNMREAYARRRKTPAKGHTHANAKLTKAQVKEIRRMYKTGKYIQSELAILFSVSQVNISKVVCRKTYKEEK